MKVFSFRSDSYFKEFNKLSKDAQNDALKSFQDWINVDKCAARKVNVNDTLCSVKLNGGRRVIGCELNTGIPNTKAIVWFFIGTHNEYENMLKAKRANNAVNAITDNIKAYRNKMLKGIGLVANLDSHSSLKMK